MHKSEDLFQSWVHLQTHAEWLYERVHSNDTYSIEKFSKNRWLVLGYCLKLLLIFDWWQNFISLPDVQKDRGSFRQDIGKLDSYIHLFDLLPRQPQPQLAWYSSQDSQDLLQKWLMILIDYSLSIHYGIIWFKHSIYCYPFLLSTC